MKNMDKELLKEALKKYFSGVIGVWLLLFIPAWSFAYWNGWLFMFLLFVPMFFAGIYLLFKNPRLLRGRLDAKEKEKEQQEVIKYSGIMFVLGFVSAGLSFRFHFLVLPKFIVLIGSILFLISYLFYAEVLKENSYLSRVIKVDEDQELVDTGLYGFVRHPMYAVTLILFLSIPLILGSLISFIIFLMYPLIIIKRIKNEEQVLEKELKGYKEYKKKVKYRLIPYIW